MPVNRHSEAYDVIALLTKLKKFCPVENRHEIGRGNQDGSGAGLSIWSLWDKMTLDDLTQIIAEVQKLQSELDDLEVKAAQKGTPQRLFETLSAFSNRPGGGVLLLGLDESKRFENVGVGNAHRLQEEISHLAASEMEPPLRPEFTVKDFEGEGWPLSIFAITRG